MHITISRKSSISDSQVSIKSNFSDNLDVINRKSWLRMSNLERLSSSRLCRSSYRLTTTTFGYLDGQPVNSKFAENRPGQHMNQENSETRQFQFKKPTPDKLSADWATSCVGITYTVDTPLPPLSTTRTPEIGFDDCVKRLTPPCIFSFGRDSVFETADDCSPKTINPRSSIGKILTKNSEIEKSSHKTSENSYFKIVKSETNSEFSNRFKIQSNQSYGSKNFSKNCSFAESKTNSVTSLQIVVPRRFVGTARNWSGYSVRDSRLDSLPSSVSRISMSMKPHSEISSLRSYYRNNQVGL